MKFRSVLFFLILILLILFPSCKKKGYAVLQVSISNQSVEYKFWSISYDVNWAETAGYDCTILQDELSIVDGSGNAVYSFSFPISISVPANSSSSRSYSGILIGIYYYYDKPVRLRHTLHYSDSESGDIYTSSGDIVIHSE